MEINLELGYPTVAEAMSNLEGHIKILKKRKEKVAIIIHGYGSSGKGGAIRTKTRQWLKIQLQTNKIKGVVHGEDFEMFDELSRKIHSIEKDSSKYYGKSNIGVTLVLI